MKGIGYSEDFLMIKKDMDLIKEHITRLLLTTKRERVGSLEYGSDIKGYLFNFSPVVIQDFERTFISLINTNIPEIKVYDFSINKVDENKIAVSFSIEKKETLEKYEYMQEIQIED
jgi:phage baseplate assembly protein W